MKKAEDYLKKANEFYRCNIKMEDIFVNEEAALKAIKQAQIDAIEETCRVCAENADLTYVEYEWEIPEGTVSVGDSEYGYKYIDKQSILLTASKLINNL